MTRTRRVWDTPLPRAVTDRRGVSAQGCVRPRPRSPATGRAPSTGSASSCCSAPPTTPAATASAGSPATPWRSPLRDHVAHVRITRPGGTIGLTAWPAHGYQRAFAHLLRPTGQQPAHDSLVVSGDEDALRRQLEPVADEVRARTTELVDRFDSLDDRWRIREVSPPMANARSRPPDAYDELARQQ